MYKKMMKYFSKHPHINAKIHVLAGIGIGILVTHPLADPHPVRWGVALIALSLLGHVWAGTQK